jgi:hypothetical protein
MTRSMMNAQVNASASAKISGGVASKGKPKKKQKQTSKAKGKMREEEQHEEEPNVESEEEETGHGVPKRKGQVGPSNPAKKRRLRGASPHDDTPPLVAAFPETPPSSTSFKTQDNILEPNWEAESEGDDDDEMDVNDSSCPSNWRSLPRKVLEINVPTPRVNATGLVELVLENFQYPYRAKVCITIIQQA